MNREEFLQQYNDFTSNNDYRSLANLFRSYNYSNDELRNRGLALAEKYEEQADIEDKLIGDASPSQKAAYRFLANGPIKASNPNEQDNYYSQPFADAWNSMADENGKITLNTIIDNHDFLDDFCDASGISVDELRKYGIERGKEGSISFNTSNPHKMAIYKGINGLVNSGYDFYTSSETDYGYGAFPILDPEGATGGRLFIGKFFNNHTQVKAYRQMGELVTRANQEYADIMTSKNKPYITQTVVTGYMGEDDKRLQEAFAQGAMDLQTFKEARSLLEEKYNRVMQTSSLSQYQVYSMNEDNNGSHVLQELTDNIQKAALNDEINLAIAEGRLHYASASNGLAYGTMIVIDQKFDNKGNPVEEHPARRFFVKDLFKSEAENNLRQDTQVDAQLQYSKHQTYGHVYRMKDGGRIDNWNGSSDTAEYIDSFGNKRLVGKAEILNMMDDDIIAKRLIDYYKKANLRDSKGRQYTEESYQVYGNDGNNADLLQVHITKKALQVIAAKYGDPNSDYVKSKAVKLASVIMKALENQNINYEKSNYSTTSLNKDFYQTNNFSNIQK